MTKMTFVLAALIAASVFATQAMAAARNDSAARHVTAKDCVRAPNVGAFASAPYTAPPCMPSAAVGSFQ
jgi:hypothetical protein